MFSVLMMSQRQNDLFFNISFLVSGIGTKHAVTVTAQITEETRTLAATLHPDPKWPYFTWILTVNRPRCHEAASASKTSLRNEVEDEAAKTSLRTPKVQTAYNIALLLARCNNRAGTPPMIPPPGCFGAGSSDSGQTDSD